MANPSITSNQIAIDPVSGVFFFKDSNGALVSSSLNLLQASNTEITTEDSFEVAGNLTVTGNLIVGGNTVAINTEVITVEDKNIELANIATPSNTAADGGGITLKGTTDKTFNWSNSTSSWTSSENIDLASGKSFKINGTTVLTSTTLTANVTGNLTGNSNGAHTGNVTGDVTGNLSGNVTGNVSGNLTGTASNALVWTNQRKITLDGDVTGNVFIDGSANVTITTTIASNSVALGTDTTGDYVANLVAGTGITITDNSGEGMTPVIKVADSYTTNMVSNISNSAASVSAYADSVGNTAYSNAVTYVNNRTLDDLSGVTVSNAATNDVLLYNGSTWINDDISINKISDVLTSNVLNGQILIYDSTSSKWINSIIPEAPAGTSSSFTRGNNSDTDFTIFHGLGTADVVVTIRSNITYEVIETRWSTTDSLGAFSNNHVTVNFTNPPATDEMNITVYGSVQSTSVVITGRLDNLSGDVMIGSPSSGELLSYNGSKWINRKANITTDMGDVVISGNATGQFLKFDGNTWINSSIPTINNLDDVGDVNVSSKSTDDLLKWNGSAWVAVTPSKSMVGLSNVDNTTDLNKPISNATQTALNLKANANSSPIITLNGDLTGNVTLTNLASATLTATIAANSVALGTDTTGDYVSSLVAGTGITLTNNSGEGSTPTVAVNTSVIATKSYVDSFASGINWHAAVKAATVGSLSGNYNNGTDGVGATLTKATNGSIGTIDNASVVAGDRILLKSQTDAKQNGIYTIVTAGNGTTPWQIIRASDFDNSTSSATIVAGDAVFVTGGDTNGLKGFIQDEYGTGTNNSIVIGTDDINFTQFTGASTAVAGNGLSVTGNQFDVGTASSARIVINSDNIDLATTGVTANTYKSVTVDSYGRVTAGTNPTTLSGYGITDAVSSSLNSGYVYLGNSGNTAVGTAVSGDITISNTGNVQIASNTIVNADINSSAAIAYSKLNLSNTITNADINSSAAIAYSKLALANSIVNADINSAAAIDYSKLSLSNSINTTDLQSGAARGGFNSTLRTVTSSNTLVSTDLAKLIVANSSSDMTITVSTSATFNDGDRIDLLRAGTGEVTIAGSGITINGTPGYRLRAQWSSATLIRLNSTTWVAVGDLKV